MTCVAAIADGERVWMASDSIADDGWASCTVANPKVAVAAIGVVIGYTTAFRFGQVLHYQVRIPELPAVGADEFGWVVGPFIDAVRKALDEAGWTNRIDGRENGGTFLLGVRGRLFRVLDDFGVTEPTDHYDSVGSGYQVALGSLHSTGRMLAHDPQRRLSMALSAAEAHCSTVSGPFSVVVVE